MNEYVFRFINEEEAKSILNFLTFDGEWDTSKVIPNCRAYIITGTSTDDEGYPMEIREYEDDFFVRVRCEEITDENILDFLNEDQDLIIEPVFA